MRYDKDNSLVRKSGVDHGGSSQEFAYGVVTFESGQRWEHFSALDDGKRIDFWT